MDYNQKIKDLLLVTAKQNASDLHLMVGHKPTLRIDGSLMPLQKEAVLNPESAEGMILALMSDEAKARLKERKNLDFYYNLEDKARFRINAYFQRGFIAAALRLIPPRIKAIEELLLPPVLHTFTRLKQGLVFLVGPTGHGKSTTLAAMVDEINHKRADHIITIEDPIEFFFVQDRCIISQREIGSDVLSYADGLKSILRQDPNVVVVGDIRDLETLETVLTLAETGHLVFSTLHTNSAAQTIDRILNSYPANQQNQISSQLAASLSGIVSERLIPRVSGGRMPACEVLIANSAVKNLIREGKSYQIDLVIETSLQEGMVSLNRYLATLVKRREISLENAEIYATNVVELRNILERL